MPSIILIVDDDVPRVRRTADWLIDAGYRVVHTRDVWSAALAVGAVRAAVVVVAAQAIEVADDQARARFAEAVSAAGIVVVTSGHARETTAPSEEFPNSVRVPHDRARVIAAVDQYAGPRLDTLQDLAERNPLSENP
jgi:DNA-binding NtrC family response regulator